MDESGAVPVDLRARERSLFTNVDAPCNIRQKRGNKLSSAPKTTFQWIVIVSGVTKKENN